MLIAVGSYTPKTEPGIYLYQLDPDAEEFDLLKVIAGVENPSYLAVSAKGDTLFAIRENKEGDEGQLSSYLIADEDIAFKESKTYEGGGSCFITTDSDSQYAFIANYGSGTLAVLKLSDDASISAKQLIKFTGSGPNSDRQDKSHIHAAVLSPDERFLYCTDLGADRLYRFRFNANAAKSLVPDEPHYINLPPGSGPRHMTFDRSGRWLYVLSELSGEIFRFSVKMPLTTWLQQVTIVSESYKGEVAAGDITVHPAGKVLYASLRGEANEIVSFRIDQRNGKLTFFQRISVEGSSPRSLAISEDGKMLLAANEKSNNITMFRISPDGKLKYKGKELKVAKPACIKFIHDNNREEMKVANKAS